MLPEWLNAEEMPKKNVLFIIVDDLRPELNCYGSKHIVSPNIDNLAATGMLFNRAYCQVAICSASRSSVLTGVYPDKTKVYWNDKHFRDALPDVTTLPQHFRNNGYHSISISKVYHDGFEDPKSWSEPLMELKGIRNEGKFPAGFPFSGQPTRDADVPDNIHCDGVTADRSIEVLRRIKNKPFFFAVGIIRPHLSYLCPKKYWDLYDPNEIKLSEHPFLPKGLPGAAMPYMNESLKKRTSSDDLRREFKHGYYACTSFADAQIGRILDELENLKLADNTIIVLWGDNGFHLGEQGLWMKATNFEATTRVPLIVRVPGMKNKGVKCNRFVDSVDIYPTVCELAGLTLPEHLEGKSFVPLLEDAGIVWQQCSFSQINGKKGMGYSMRTENYRYTEWVGTDEKTVGAELYDYRNAGEDINLAIDKNFKSIVEEHAKMLRDNWRPKWPY
ncbi:MAG: hypothetical protein A2096_13660 [Spirochaetes bacterium GWF1_41_5]|nr:MAG: hypothetical protein A2096_13660 [Spirochaetes bacterium GWF1_41_5]HBE02776.1 iduronate sulfatase [Spirochaetia bacterium]